MILVWASRSNKVECPECGALTNKLWRCNEWFGEPDDGFACEDDFCTDCKERMENK